LDLGSWQKVAVLGAALLLGLCGLCSCVTAFELSPLGQQVTAQANATSTAQASSDMQAIQSEATATQYAALHSAPTSPSGQTPTPTLQPAPQPTAQPTAKPTPKPTTSPPPPIATSTPTTCPGVNCNPWGYNFTPGNLIYNPPGTFCAYFNCIQSFWTTTNGYVEECHDATFSHTGGRSGSCFRHGGNWRPLYSH
jgi:hypothetical protein